MVICRSNECSEAEYGAVQDHSRNSLRRAWHCGATTLLFLDDACAIQPYRETRCYCWQLCSSRMRVVFLERSTGFR